MDIKETIRHEYDGNGNIVKAYGIGKARDFQNRVQVILSDDIFGYLEIERMC